MRMQLASRNRNLPNYIHTNSGGTSRSQHNLVAVREFILLVLELPEHLLLLLLFLLRINALVPPGALRFKHGPTETKTARSTRSALPSLPPHSSHATRRATTSAPKSELTRSPPTNSSRP